MDEAEILLNSMAPLLLSAVRLPVSVRFRTLIFPLEVERYALFAESSLSDESAPFRVLTEKCS